MKVYWEYEAQDVLRVEQLMERMGSSYLVQHRIARNVEGSRRDPITQETVWYAMVSCLLTTQQRSGPNSKINILIRARPFPLGLAVCRAAEDLEELTVGVAQEWGIRRGPTIGGELRANLLRLETADGWADLLALLHSLETCPGPMEERGAAQQIATWLKGFGPKQARNLLQMLGLTKHEIPLDSRVVKWLRNAGFPAPLVPMALSDEAYYCFVMDRVQELCAEAKILPCVLDALVFAAADDDAWTAANHVW